MLGNCIRNTAIYSEIGGDFEFISENILIFKKKLYKYEAETGTQLLATIYHCEKM